VLCLILAVGLTPAFSAACAVRCAAGAASIALGGLHTVASTADHAGGGCHDRGAPGGHASTDSSAAMDAMCAFASAGAITISVLPIVAASPPALAAFVLPAGESILLQPPDPPPRA
jgi:hypothetical protein